MEKMRVLDTDWWIFFATIISGILASVSTIIAVIITNNETRKQLKEQQAEHEKELIEQNKTNKFVVVKPSIMLTSFAGLLDRIIIQNNYNRELLLSGEDGFTFFDDSEKRQGQKCRILHIENTSDNPITDIVLSTSSCLENRSTNELKRYETSNVVKYLRSRESIDIRLANQEQFESIIQMNEKKTPSEFVFESTMEYSTQARQRVTYCFNVRISNDRCPETLKDEVMEIKDCDKMDLISTVFRNLQDYIEIDRASYVWKKMGQSQAMGLFSVVNPSVMMQSNINTKAENDESASEWQ